MKRPDRKWVSVPGSGAAQLSTPADKPCLAVGLVEENASPPSGPNRSSRLVKVPVSERLCLRALPPPRPGSPLAVAARLLLGANLAFTRIKVPKAAAGSLHLPKAHDYPVRWPDLQLTVTPRKQPAGACGGSGTHNLRVDPHHPPAGSPTSLNCWRPKRRIFFPVLCRSRGDRCNYGLIMMLLGASQTV